MRRIGTYGPKPRTQADMVRDAMLFIYNAYPHRLLEMTPERLCADKGVTGREDRRCVEAALIVAQQKERERA